MILKSCSRSSATTAGRPSGSRAVDASGGRLSMRVPYLFGPIRCSFAAPGCTRTDGSGKEDGHQADAHAAILLLGGFEHVRPADITVWMLPNIPMPRRSSERLARSNTMYRLRLRNRAFPQQLTPGIDLQPICCKQQPNPLNC